MALNIKNPAVEALASQVAQLARETKTEAIRKALQERLARLSAEQGRRPSKERMIEYFQKMVWPNIPKEVRGKPITKREREEILGYGPDGV